MKSFGAKYIYWIASFLQCGLFITIFESMYPFFIAQFAEMAKRSKLYKLHKMHYLLIIQKLPKMQKAQIQKTHLHCTIILPFTFFAKNMNMFCQILWNHQFLQFQHFRKYHIFRILQFCWVSVNSSLHSSTSASKASIALSTIIPFENLLITSFFLVSEASKNGVN